MRFSVILPTRNGGKHLPLVLESILGVGFDAFELVVADNANSDDTPALLASRSSNPRLRVVRSDTLLSVTDNWMAGLRAARGEYVVVIGDDDYLMQDFFERADTILRRHGDPDGLTVNGFTFVEPGAVDESRDAYFSPEHFRFPETLREEREVSWDERRAIVADMFRFRVRFPLNMQLTVFARRMVDRVPPPFFRPPFPDHFALNSLLLLADRFVVAPDRLVVVGVSGKSFGHFFYTGRQTEGMSYLGSASDFPGRLDGSELLNSMHLWLQELKRAYPVELRDIGISRWGYAARQVYAWYREIDAGRLSARQFARRARHLRPVELGTVLVPLTGYRLLRRLAHSGRNAVAPDYWPSLRPAVGVRSIGEFADALRRGTLG